MVSHVDRAGRVHGNAFGLIKEGRAPNAVGPPRRGTARHRGDNASGRNLANAGVVGVRHVHVPLPINGHGLRVGKEGTGSRAIGVVVGGHISARPTPGQRADHALGRNDANAVIGVAQE